MRRLLVLLLSFVLVFASCGEAAVEKDNTDSSDVTEVFATAEEPTKATENIQTDPSEQATDPEEPSGNTDISEPTGEGATPLLYKVSDDDSVVWLMGTIHLGKESFYPFPDYVTHAYEGADALAVECDIIEAANDVTLAYQIVRANMYTDGTSIEDHIDSSLYERAKSILEENGMYVRQYDYLMPIFWSDIIDNYLYNEANVNFNLGVDNYFLARAKEDGKEILEIESVLFQYKILAAFSPELQEALLESSVETTVEEVKETFDSMMSVWESGDEEDMIVMVMDDDGFSEEEPDLSKEYNDAIIVNRNIGMTDFAEKALNEDKEVFICVGMAHVVGNDAMVELLRERGYTVEIVK